MSSVVGLYYHRRDALEAVEALTAAGFSRDDISLVTRSEDEGADVTEGAATGAGLGALLGGVGGLLVGLGTVVLPGLGLLVAAGPLVGALTGAAAGAVAGGLVGALIDLGLPEEEAELYAEGVRRGGTMVVVHGVSEAREDEAATVLERYNPINIEERTESWRGRGWTGYDVEAEPYTSDQIERERKDYDNRLVTPEDVLEESDDETWSLQEPEFRRHYKTAYADTGRDYTYYEAAYRYGCRLTKMPQYRTYSWERIESRAREQWERDHEAESWPEVRDAIYTSYVRCRA